MVDPPLLWYINSTGCQRRLGLLCFMCETAFDIEHDHNLLCCDNCLYKRADSGDDISQVNVYGIKKKYSLNYLTTPEYQALLVDEVLGDELGERNARPIPLPNQAQRAACVTVLDDFYMSKLLEVHVRSAC